MPRVVRLLTSAGPGEGRGHLSRALALAEARWPDDVEVELMVARGVLSPAERARAAAAGVGIGPEAGPPDDAILVVDAPDPTTTARGVRPDRLVVFDDSERFEGDAAVVVQPSLPEWAGRARAGRVLAGYEWAPIGSAWRAVRDDHPPSGPGDTPRLLVCFGGSDPHDVTRRLGGVLAEDMRWAATVVVGPDYRGDGGANVQLVREPDDLPVRVAAADLVVSGAGTTKFEIAALGRPAILVATADDQLAVGPPFAATGAARWLGDGRSIDPEVVRDAVAALLADGPARGGMSDAASALVDGRGADRLAAAISAVADPSQASAS